MRVKAYRNKDHTEVIGYTFRCPGCGDYHSVAVKPYEHRTVVWNFNGSEALPTFRPSLLVKSGHYVDGKTNECWCTYNKTHEPAPFTCYICHSFITEGKIEFLGDCTHSLAGKTVDLPEIADE